MKNVEVLSRSEQNEINGGGFARKHRPITINDWNPNLGWEGSGPNGNQHFPG